MGPGWITLFVILALASLHFPLIKRVFWPKPRKCPKCKSPNHIVEVSKDGGLVLQCQNCGHQGLDKVL